MIKPQPKYRFDPLISKEDISTRVQALGDEITRNYSMTDSLVAVGLLNGAFLFMADLVRNLDLPVEIDFMKISSYGNDTTASGDMHVETDIKRSIKDRDVLVIEDIVDTGITLNWVVNDLSARQPKSLEVCCLLDKPSRRKVEVPIRWIGFEVPDVFVVGYGLDYAQGHRNLPHISKVTEQKQ